MAWETGFPEVIYTKSSLLLDFSRGAQRVSPVCCVLLLWFRWGGCEKVDPYRHGRDGHAPPFSAAKSNFKGTMVSIIALYFCSTFIAPKNQKNFTFFLNGISVFRSMRSLCKQCTSSVVTQCIPSLVDLSSAQLWSQPDFFAHLNAIAPKK